MMITFTGQSPQLLRGPYNGRPNGYCARMYKEYFGLRDVPFSITPDPRYVYMSPHHREALGHLLYGTGEDGGFVQITGEVGTGKTTLIRTLLEQQLPEVDVALILNPRLNVPEFLAAICDELRVANPRPAASLKQLVDALNAHLLKTHALGKRTVLIVDEAQHLSRDVLEQVRLLTNLETHRHKLLRIMLVGQPELRDLLARKDLRQLAQRITARYHLASLNRQQTREYVMHRLQVAGGKPALFTNAALRDIYRLTHGTPRLINIICDRALLGAYGQGKPQVTRAILRHAAQEVLDQGARSRREGRVSELWPWLAMLGASVALGASLYLGKPYLDRVLPAEAAAVTAADDSQTNPEPVVPQSVAVVPPPTAEPAPPSAVPGPEPTRPEYWLAEAAALTQLANLWGVKMADGDGIQCMDLNSRGLRCLSGSAGWSELRGFNLPVTLTLNTPDGNAYVAVRRLESGNALLLSDRGETTVSIGSLSEQWTGDFQIIWRPQVKATYIGPDSEQSAIRWLLKRLEIAEGSAAGIVSLPYRYDAAVRERVRRFQDSRGLEADGLVGARTMIHLNALAPEAGAPVLVAKAGKG